MKEKVIGFIKKDTVLCVAMTLAMVSAFFVKPTLNYVNYIDFLRFGHFIKPDDGYGRASEKWLV